MKWTEKIVCIMIVCENVPPIENLKKGLISVIKMWSVIKSETQRVIIRNKRSSFLGKIFFL